MVSLDDVINSLNQTYDLFKQYVAQNEDYFNLSEVAEMLNETFKEMLEIIAMANGEGDSDWNGDDNLC